MTGSGSTVPSIKRFNLLSRHSSQGTLAFSPICRQPVLVVEETMTMLDEFHLLSATAPASLLLAFIVHFLQSTYHCHQVHSFLLQNGLPLRLVMIVAEVHSSRVIMLEETLLNLGPFVRLLPAYRLLLA